MTSYRFHLADYLERAAVHGRESRNQTVKFFAQKKLLSDPGMFFQTRLSRAVRMAFLLQFGIQSVAAC